MNFFTCGAARAAAAAILFLSICVANSTAQSGALVLETTALRGGHQAVLRTSGGQAGDVYAVLADGLPADLPLPGGARMRLALTPALTLLQSGFFDAQGRADGFLSLPQDPALYGRAFYLQSISFDATSGVLRTSNRIDAAIEATREAYVPTWSSAAPTRVLSIDFDGARTNAENGERLHNQMQALQPGDALIVGDGRWWLERRVDLGHQGTVTAPIRIVAAPGARPTLTRSNASQNVINIGDWRVAKFLLLRGFEVTGGSFGLRVYEAEDLWIDECEIHHIDESGISANSGDCARLYLTRNSVHDTAGYGEGLYLGANNGLYVVRDSVIAKNHVYDTRAGTQQGDGIELKQGSYGNLIAENYVHGTRYPCILVYGTGGRAPNVIENNICIDSLDVVMQVQGEAIVRNNLLMNGTIGFLSRDHQGQVRNLSFVHNTIINIGAGAYLRNWNSTSGMLFANNVVYSRDANAVEFASGSIGVPVQGNVLFGGLLNVPGGYVRGNGIQDFMHATWNAAVFDARPASLSVILGSGDPTYAEPLDLLGQIRVTALEAGCLDGL